MHKGLERKKERKKESKQASKKERKKEPRRQVKNKMYPPTLGIGIAMSSVLHTSEGHPMDEPGETNVVRMIDANNGET